MQVMTIKVAGVTYEGRQGKIQRLTGVEPVRIVPEPDNAYDPNALAIHVSLMPPEMIEAAQRQPELMNPDDPIKPEILHVGYIPAEFAARLAPILDGESLDVRIVEIPYYRGIYGLRVTVELPDDVDTTGLPINSRNQPPAGSDEFGGF